MFLYFWAILVFKLIDSHNELFNDLLHLILTLFHPNLFLFTFSESIKFLFETFNIFNWRLENCPFVWPDISDNLVVRFVAFWQKYSEFFNTVVNVESPSALNCEYKWSMEFRYSGKYMNVYLLMLWLSFFWRSFTSFSEWTCGSSLFTFIRSNVLFSPKKSPFILSSMSSACKTLRITLKLEVGPLYIF